MPATLESRLPMIVAEMRTKVSAAAKWGAEMIAEDAQSLAPDRTPYGAGLVDAIHVERAGPAAYSVVAGDKEHFYAHFVEFGTAASDKRGFSTPAKPFLIPAAEGRRLEIEAVVTGVLRGL